jgi:hypothetical protein
VLRGKWKLVISASTARKRAPGTEEEARLAGAARARLVRRRSSRAQRTLVVPTATTRAPRARQRRTASTVVSGQHEALRVHRVRVRVVDRGPALNVPSPTCSVTLARSTPARSSRASNSGGEVQSGGRRRDRAELAREHGLVRSSIDGRAPRRRRRARRM